MSRRNTTIAGRGGSFAVRNGDRLVVCWAQRGGGYVARATTTDRDSWEPEATTFAGEAAAWHCSLTYVDTPKRGAR